MEIEIPFRQFRPDNFPAPLIEATFSNGNQKIPVLCLVDSGADFTTMPQSLGILLGINFERIAPYEIRKKWEELDKNNPKELKKLVEEITGKKYALPTSFGCACGNTTQAKYYPATIELKEGFKKEILVLWSPQNTTPLLGRIGFFDKMKEIIFKDEQKLMLKF